jgi:uncharacterized protein YlxP (DUF503 family)
MSKLQRDFNLSVAEIGLQDKWQEALIGCAMIGTECAHLESAMHTIQRWVEGNWSDGDVIACSTEW